MAELTLHFYDLDKCGFYKHGTDTHLFAGPSDVLADLLAWSSGKDVSMTELLSPRRASTEHLPVYVFGMASGTDEYLLATWNRVPSAQNSIASLAKASRVGATPKVHNNSIAANSIPGFPTYFWFVPSRNLFAAVKFDIPVLAVRPMLGYVRRYLQIESAYAVEDSEGSIVGFRDKRATGAPVKAKVAFDGAPRVNPGSVAKLYANQARIRTVIRDGTLSQSVQKDKTWFQRLSQYIRDSQSGSSLQRESRVHIALQYTPTMAELQDMVRTEQASARLGDNDDLGFKLEGETDILWLNSVRSKKNVTVPWNVPSNGVVEVDALFRELSGRKTHILKGV